MHLCSLQAIRDALRKRPLQDLRERGRVEDTHNAATLGTLLETLRLLAHGCYQNEEDIDRVRMPSLPELYNVAQLLRRDAVAIEVRVGEKEDEALFQGGGVGESGW